MAGIGFDYLNAKRPPRGPGWPPMLNFTTFASLHCTVLVLTLVLHLPAGPPAPSPPFHCGALGLRWGRVVGTRWRVITHPVHFRCRCRLPAN